MTKLCIYLAIFLLLQSCTLLFEKSCQDITITTNPPGAFVLFDDNYSGFTTPLQICLPKGRSRIITIKKQGYYEKRIIAYNTKRRTDLSKHCKNDLIYGWFMLIPIPVITARNSKKCQFLHKDTFQADLTPIPEGQELADF